MHLTLYWPPRPAPYAPLAVADPVPDAPHKLCLAHNVVHNGALKGCQLCAEDSAYNEAQIALHDDREGG